MNSRVNRSTGKAPKEVKNKDFLSIFYKNPISQYKKPRFKAGDKIRISKYDILFRKGYKSRVNSLKLLRLLLTNLQHTTSRESRGILGKLYDQELSKCII